MPRNQKQKRREYKMLFAGGAASIPGAQFMGFEVLYADCDEGVLTTDASGIERFTGCGTPPGADEYGTYFIEDYFGFMNDLTDPELIGPKALAIYWYDWVECENRWDLLMIEWNGGC